MSRKVVVIGAGAAGCALARRLTNDPDTEVLLLESGASTAHSPVEVPARWPALLGGEFDHGYQSTTQTGAADRIYPVPRGNALGGTSAINAMIHAAPSFAETSTWGGAWDDADRARVLSEIAGDTGLMPHRQAPTPHPVCAAFVEAGAEAGHPLSGGMNSDRPAGAGLFDLAIADDGRRADAYTVYLADVSERPNLEVRTGTRVNRIESVDGRIRAVEGTRDGVEFVERVDGEVVLCAGAIDSAAILMRSGLGPANQLAAAGVETVVDLPGVGQNLHDHPMVPVVWEMSSPGPAPTNQLFESYLLLPEERRAADQTLSIAFGHIPFPLPGTESPLFGASALVGQYSPRSRGTLTLTSSAAFAVPEIDPAYLTDHRDLDALVGGIQIVRELVDQPALQPLGLREVAPGPTCVDRGDVEEFVRSFASSFFHPVGTCSAGGPNPVVDAAFRVRGTANLRVADASVLPTIPAVATSVSAQMIGWRAAEVLLAGA